MVVDTSWAASVSAVRRRAAADSVRSERIDEPLEIVPADGELRGFLPVDGEGVLGGLLDRILEDRSLVRGAQLERRAGVGDQSVAIDDDHAAAGPERSQRVVVR